MNLKRAKSHEAEKRVYLSKRPGSAHRGKMKAAAQDKGRVVTEILDKQAENNPALKRFADALAAADA